MNNPIFFIVLNVPSINQVFIVAKVFTLSFVVHNIIFPASSFMILTKGFPSKFLDSSFNFVNILWFFDFILSSSIEHMLFQNIVAGKMWLKRFSCTYSYISNNVTRSFISGLSGFFYPITGLYHMRPGASGAWLCLEVSWERIMCCTFTVEPR